MLLLPLSRSAPKVANDLYSRAEGYLLVSIPVPSTGHSKPEIDAACRHQNFLLILIPWN